ADGGDDRDEIVGNQPVDQVDVDLGDFTHVADVDDLRLVHARGATAHLELARTDQVGVLAGQAEGLAAMLVDQVDDVLVHLAAEHHLHHIHGGAVGDAHARDDFACNGMRYALVTDLWTVGVLMYRV